MKQTAVLLFVALLLFGCTSVPKKGDGESAEAVSKAEIETVEEKGQVIQEEAIPEKLALLTREYSYYGDGLLDTYIVFTYSEDTAELLKEEFYNNLNELTQTVSYEYNNGSVFQKVTHDPKGKRNFYRVYSYNDRSLLESESRFDGEDNLQTVSEYEYDDSGNRMKWSLYDGSGAMLAFNTYLYEGKKNIRIDFFNPSGMLEKYSVIEYDADSNKVKESLYLSSNKLENFTLYTYEDNMLILESSFKGTEKHIRSASYEHDQDGSMVRIKYLNKQKKIIEIKEREYMYIKI